MIKRLTLDAVGSFKTKTELQLEKKINLFYGLNGSGKSTVCRFLRDRENAKYAQCKVESDFGPKFLVFNEDFIRENFFESGNIKGVFSLSKTNKDAEKVIKDANIEIASAESKAKEITDREGLRSRAINERKEKLLNAAFDIKRRYAGGDRVLEFCLEGVMAKKEKLFEKLSSHPKPETPLSYTIEDLQSEARLLQESKPTTEPPLPKISSNLDEIESDPLLITAIVGSTNSSFAEFIEKIKASDWVKEGLGLVSANQLSSCPFCQQKTLDDQILMQLSDYFDQTYEDNLEKLKSIEVRYSEMAQSIPPLQHLKSKAYRDDKIDVLHEKLVALASTNVKNIQEKILQPSKIVELHTTQAVVSELNDTIEKANREIATHNLKVLNKPAAFSEIKSRFWSVMRVEFEQKLAHYEDIEAESNKHLSLYNTELSALSEVIRMNQEMATNAQRDTVNIDGAIDRINAELLDIGISDFKIKKHQDHLYTLHREDSEESEFRSLSEGEKMIIGLLYFCELCEGKESPDEVDQKKVVALDDPISSMSHIFIFNVGRLLLSRFTNNNNITQVLIFTHSLYFFYEMTNPNREKRKETQALFRVSKGTTGSVIKEMKYEEIRNDYQAYWQIINDRTQAPALIANCMRNVVEHFFGFVEKTDFANVFQKQEMKTNQLQAFNRYMNRESHSFGQNVFDLKEFDYDAFRAGLDLLFDNAGYGEHYKKMTSIPV